ncbi:uncharacterized protein LOC143246730 [Tachypleus tridentatus]|uniref:uncharacterized protein LOC143246730 n=1 Tax=Tachypleus tridentatus TaxID=6853 RepID=UPI003FD349B1
MREVNKPTTAASTSDEKKCDKKVNKSKLENEDPLRVPGTERQPLTDWMTDRDPFGVGRGDLDPFGGGAGGGMLMDPSRFRTPGGPFGPPPISSGFPGRLPRCAVPPGARFDHYGPAAPDPDRFSRPDPDNLPPPGYEDMFF